MHSALIMICSYSQYRRHKYSAVTKLRSYILKKLHSFSSPSQQNAESADTVQPPQITPTKLSDQMESSVVIDSTKEMKGDRVILAENADSASVEDLESITSIQPSSSSETLEELMDQMEIQISDHESAESMGEGGEGQEEGVVLLGHMTGAEDGDSEGDVVTSEKIESSTRLVTGQGGLEGGKAGGQVMVVGTEGGSVRDPPPTRKRKASSSHEKIEFPVISMQKQLSNEDSVELMGLLQVRWNTPSLV